MLAHEIINNKQIINNFFRSTLTFKSCTRNSLANCSLVLQTTYFVIVLPCWCSFSVWLLRFAIGCFGRSSRFSRLLCSFLGSLIVIQHNNVVYIYSVFTCMVIFSFHEQNHHLSNYCSKYLFHKIFRSFLLLLNDLLLILCE